MRQVRYRHGRQEKSQEHLTFWDILTGNLPRQIIPTTGLNAALCILNSSWILTFLGSAEALNILCMYKDSIAKALKDCHKTWVDNNNKIRHTHIHLQILSRCKTYSVCKQNFRTMEKYSTCCSHLILKSTEILHWYPSFSFFTCIHFQSVCQNWLHSLWALSHHKAPNQ